MLTLVLWQHVVFLCVSVSCVSRKSLLVFVHRMLCSVRLAQHTTHNHNQAHSKQRTTAQECFSEHNICLTAQIVIRQCML